MTTTRIIGEERDPRATQRPRRESAAQVRAFEAALARAGAPPATTRASSTLPPLSGPLSDTLLRGRHGEWREGSDRRAQADEVDAADEANPGRHGDAADAGDFAGDLGTDPSRDRRPHAPLDGDVDAEAGAKAEAHVRARAPSRDDAERDIDTTHDAETDEAGSRDSAEGRTDKTDSAASTVPANARRSSDGDADSGSGGEGGGDGRGDRDGMARHTQDALLAALTAPAQRGEKERAAAPMPLRDLHVAVHASPLAQGQSQAMSHKADEAVLRSMLAAIDALRVDVDGRGGVEMDVSVAGTQGMTVRIEEYEGCLQTTLACRETGDAMRLQPGVGTLAARLAGRFARAARVRIESPSDKAPCVVLAEAYAPAPSGESV